MDDFKLLSNGVRMPALGFGTYHLSKGGECREAVLSALNEGYRLIDTAAFYENEKDVGQAIRESGIPREEIFVTTKLWRTDQGYEKALRAFGRSQKALDIGPIDLYLIHWPTTEHRSDSWKALEQLYKEGECRAIGVSNYTERHLQQLFTEADVQPMVQQIELSPFLQQRGLVQMCLEHGMAVQAYCPLTRGKRFKDNTVGRVATEVGRTPAQVLLRWSLQKGFVPLPKSAHPQRIIENHQVFDFSLSPEQMRTLDDLDGGTRVSWDSSSVL